MTRPRIVTVGRYSAGWALVEVGTTTTVRSHEALSEWTTIAGLVPFCAWSVAPREARRLTTSPRRTLELVKELANLRDQRPVLRVVRQPLRIRRHPFVPPGPGRSDQR